MIEIHLDPPERRTRRSILTQRDLFASLHLELPDPARSRRSSDPVAILTTRPALLGSLGSRDENDCETVLRESAVIASEFSSTRCECWPPTWNYVRPSNEIKSVTSCQERAADS